MLSPMKILSLQINDEDGTNSSISSPGLFSLIVSGIVGKIGRYVMYERILCPKYIYGLILYIQYPTHIQG